MNTNHLLQDHTYHHGSVVVMVMDGCCHGDVWLTLIKSDKPLVDIPCVWRSYIQEVT